MYLYFQFFSLLRNKYRKILFTFIPTLFNMTGSDQFIKMQIRIRNTARIMQSVQYLLQHMVTTKIQCSQLEIQVLHKKGQGHINISVMKLKSFSPNFSKINM